MTIEVVAKRSGRAGVHIGRPSVLGNPYVIGRDGSRAMVIAAYRVWLHERMQRDTPQRRAVYALARRHWAGEALTLVCFCKPLACHGDVIRETIEALTPAAQLPLVQGALALGTGRGR